LLCLPGRVDAAEIIEPKLDDTQCGFRHGRCITKQLSTLQRIFEKSWEHAKDVCTCFVNLGKAYGRVPRKKLWRRCGSMVLTGASFWPSSNCIPVQTFASVSTELIQTVQRWCWTMVCAVTTLLHVYIRVLQTTARGPNYPTCEAISPGHKRHFANKKKIIYLRKTVFIW